LYHPVFPSIKIYPNCPAHNKSKFTGKFLPFAFKNYHPISEWRFELVSVGRIANSTYFLFEDCLFNFDSAIYAGLPGVVNIDGKCPFATGFEPIRFDKPAVHIDELASLVAKRSLDLYHKHGFVYARIGHLPAEFHPAVWRPLTSPIAGCDDQVGCRLRYGWRGSWFRDYALAQRDQCRKDEAGHYQDDPPDWVDLQPIFEHAAGHTQRISFEITQLIPLSFL
jgi:hypothetical protein